MEEVFIADEYYKRKRKEELAIGWWWPIVIGIVGSLIYFLVYINDGLLPAFVPIERKDPYLICGECSRQMSRKFTSLGPRIVGTPVNEVETPRILIEELNKIKNMASPEQVINITMQKGSGGYHLEYIPPFINIYDEVQNVMVMLEGSEGNHSILINCHYDTVEISPGASDDMISCTAMVEVLRYFSISEIKFRHNMVFLFNGAEETYFQGSHLFLQHEWAKKCKIVVNLEACGVGGRNILFQSGPNHPWLFKHYAKSAPHPHGQILGEELFQNGVIPSDSDFRIFRDFGNMPGLDFAFWRNGYAYHTTEDSERLIPIGSHQFVGENLRSILDALANADELDNLEENSNGQMVYYDYLGWFMIYYSNTVSKVLNSLAIILGFASIVVFIIRTINSLHPGYHWSILIEFSFATIAIIIAMGLALSISIIISLILDAGMTYKMVWYSNPMIIIPFYWFPSVAIYMLIPYLMDLWRSIKHQMSIMSLCQMYLVASQIPWLLAMIILLCIGSRSTAVLFLYVTSSAIANLIIHGTPLHRKEFAWIWVYLAIHLPALLYNIYIVIMAYMFFLPIFGRSGAGNSEMTLSMITAVAVLFTMSFVLPMIILVKKPGIVMGLLAITSFIVVICAITDTLNYPYSIDRPQRFFIMHTNREFRNEKNEMRREDNGFFIYNYDSNTMNGIYNHIDIDTGDLISLADDCKNELFCGLPLYGSRMISMSAYSSWLPSEKPKLPLETELRLKGNDKNCNRTTFVCEPTFILQGPDRFTLTFSPRNGASLFDWSLPSKIVPTGEWKGQDAYLVHIVRTNTEDKEITLRFNVSDSQINGDPIVDIGLAGNFIHHEEDHTEEFISLLYNIRLFSSTDAWISAYRGYVF